MIKQELREKGIDALVGCSVLKLKIRKAVASCMATGDIFPHTLLYGLGGTGKTAFAEAIGEELGCVFKTDEAATMKSREVVLSTLSSHLCSAQQHEKRLIWFIDEIHRLSIDRQESLYFPMKDWSLNGKSIPEWTLIGATTRHDELDGNSFVNRFRYKWKVDRYQEYEIREIVARYFVSQGMGFGPKEQNEIAKRSFGIPRICISLCEMVRDEVYAYHPKDPTVYLRDVLNSFNLEGIDDIGLSRDHRTYLLKLFSAHGDPRGLKTLSSSLSMNPSVVEDSIEPILLSLGFVDATRSGRKLTTAGHLHLANQGMI